MTGEEDRLIHTLGTSTRSPEGSHLMFRASSLAVPPPLHSAGDGEAGMVDKPHHRSSEPIEDAG